MSGKSQGELEVPQIQDKLSTYNNLTFAIGFKLKTCSTSFAMNAHHARSSFVNVRLVSMQMSHGNEEA